MKFDLLSILLIVTLFQGAFILSVLAIKHPLRPGHRLFLFLMVLVIVWFQAEFLSVRLPYGISFNLFYGTRYGAWLILGPLYYLYVRSITGEQADVRRMLPHFAPFVLFWLILPLCTTAMVGRQQVHYGMLSTFFPFIKGMQWLQYFYSGLFIVQFFHVLIYLIISYVLVTRYEKTLKGNYSKIDTTTILWLKTLNVLLMVVVVFVTIFLVLFFLYRSYDRQQDYIYVIPMAIITYLISYKLAGVEWTREPGPEKTGKYERTALKPDVALRIRKQLEERMTQSRPYLNNELRLQDLAEQVNAPPYQLSQVINDQLSLTFFDYINKYRVEEAKRLIIAEPDSTLLEIAFKAGFNNKTSFSNSFKKFTTQTALEFRKSQRPTGDR
jgi:AraC-like DNA-binding protein